MDGKISDYVHINGGVPQGIVQLYKASWFKQRDLEISAGDITISVPVRRNSETERAEVKNVESWGANNGMSEFV